MLLSSICLVPICNGLIKYIVIDMVDGIFGNRPICKSVISASVKQIVAAFLSILSPYVFLQVLAALGTEYFENVLPDLIRHCSHQKASVRDGYLTLFKVNSKHFIYSSNFTLGRFL